MQAKIMFFSFIKEHLRRSMVRSEAEVMWLYHMQILKTYTYSMETILNRQIHELDGKYDRQRMNK